MYEMADQSWRTRPKQMSRPLPTRPLARIGEHVRRHAVGEIGLVLHGGEPLLAGPDIISRLVAAVRDAVGDRVTTHASVQTNGVGLDDRLSGALRASSASTSGSASMARRTRRTGIAVSPAAAVVTSRQRTGCGRLT